MTPSMGLVLASIGIQNELIVIIAKMPSLMWRRFSSTNIPCLLPILPTIPIVAQVIIASTQVGDLEIHVTPKVVPLILF